MGRNRKTWPSEAGAKGKRKNEKMKTEKRPNNIKQNNDSSKKNLEQFEQFEQIEQLEHSRPAVRDEH